jgi:hypothetical protein
MPGKQHSPGNRQQAMNPFTNLVDYRWVRHELARAGELPMPASQET